MGDVGEYASGCGGDQEGEVGLHLGEVGEAGDVGDKCRPPPRAGLVGLYSGDVRLKAGEAGLKLGDDGLYVGEVGEYDGDAPAGDDGE